MRCLLLGTYLTSQVALIKLVFPSSPVSLFQLRLTIYGRHAAEPQ